MTTMYGLARCDSCRKARAWLDGHGVEHRFVDYRDTPVPQAELARYAGQLGWEKLINRAGTTWRQLPEARRSPSTDADWLTLVGEFPALIRRPLLVREDGTVMAGFDAGRYAEAFR